MAGGGRGETGRSCPENRWEALWVVMPGLVRFMGVALATSRALGRMHKGVWCSVVPAPEVHSMVTGPCGKGVGCGRGGEGEAASGAHCCLSHVQDYPITDVCQILQKAKELQDSK